MQSADDVMHFADDINYEIIARIVIADEFVR